MGPEYRRVTPLPDEIVGLDETRALSAFNTLEKSGEQQIAWTTYQEAKTLHDHPILARSGLFRAIVRRRAEREASRWL